MIAFAVLLLLAMLAPAQEFEVLHVRPNIYMLASAAGNVTLQVGDSPGHDGVRPSK